MDEQEWLAERFEEHRTRLRAVAYRMLGSLSEADDAVQEAWLRLSRTDADEVENLGGWLTTVVARVCLNMLRSRQTAARGAARTCTCPTRSSIRVGRRRPRARGAAGRLGRPRAARRAGDADPGRAARVRPARHVRRAVRRDRADRGPLARGGAPARQPGAPPRPGRRARPRRRPRHAARGRRGLPRRRARRRLRRARSPCSTPTSCCAPTPAPVPGATVEVRGAAEVAGRARASRGWPRRAAGARQRRARHGRAAATASRSRSAAFTVAGGRIVEMDILADPERLAPARPARLDG